MTTMDIGDDLTDIYGRIYDLEQGISDPDTVGVYPPDLSVTTITFPGTTPLVIKNTPPNAATGLIITPTAFLDNLLVDVSWTAPVAGEYVSAYDVELAKKNTSGGTYQVPRVQRVYSTSTRFEGLDASSTYGVRVIPVGRLGAQGVALPAAGYTDFATISDTTIPAQVTGLVLTPGPTSVTAVWNEVADDDVRLGAGLYQIDRDTVNTFSSGNLKSVRVSGTIATITGLASGTLLYFRVSAIDSSGNQGPPSSTVSVTPGSTAGSDGSAPSSSPAPAVIGMVGALFVKWAAVANADNVSYEVHLSTSTGFVPSGATLVTTVDGTAAVLKTLPGVSTPLSYGTTYFIKIIATDKDGAAAASAQGSGTLTPATTADLAVGSITAASGIIGSLDAAVISTGTLAAGRIAANSITTDKLSVVAFGGNQLSNGGLEDLNSTGTFPAGWNNVSGVWSLAAASISGIRSWSTTVTAGGGTATFSSTARLIPVMTGQTWRVGFVGAVSAAITAGIRLQVWWYDAAGAGLGVGNPLVILPAASTPAGTAVANYEGVITVPANARQMEVEVSLSNPNVTTTLTVGEVYAYPQIVTTSIADGVISTAKIVTAGLDAQVIKFGTMSGDRITVNTMDVNNIKASTLTSKTITIGSGGAFAIGTVPSGTGVLINDQGVRLYSAGVAKVVLDAATGTGTFTGNVTGSTISGGLVTGAVIEGTIYRTGTATGQRLEIKNQATETISGGYLRAYNSSNAATSYLLLSDAGFEMGDLVQGGYIKTTGGALFLASTAGNAVQVQDDLEVSGYVYCASLTGSSGRVVGSNGFRTASALELINGAREIVIGYAGSGGISVGNNGGATHPNGHVMWSNGANCLIRRPNGTDAAIA